MPEPIRPRILFVDSPDFAARTQKPLAAAGYHVFWCSTAMEGLHLMEREKVDLIILDLVLAIGGLSGYELCLRIKQCSRWKPIPMILLCDPRIPIEVGKDYRFELEASTLLIKPVDIDRLCLEIRSLIMPS